MSTTPTKLNIMNAALRKVGSYFLEADDTTSTTYQITNQAYLDAVLEIFAENKFNFNTKKVELTAVNPTAQTNEPYEYYFNLPSDYNFLVRLSHPTDFYTVSEYDFYNNQLHCNHATIDMCYTFIPDLSSSATTLPAYLNRLIALHMAQSIAIELSGSENRHEILHVQYVKALRRARVMEARQGPAQAFVSDGSSRVLESHQRYGTLQ